jgi:hypothetical protein
MNIAIPAPNSRENLTAFYNRLIGLLALGASNDSSLMPEPVAHPAGVAPAVLIYVGPANVSVLKQIRTRLPASSFIFYLYPACSESEEDILQATVGQAQRTVACPLAEDSFFAEKVGTLVAVNAGHEVQLVVNRDCETVFERELIQIKKVILAAQENSMQDSIRGLIRLRCSIWNLPAIVKSQRFALREFDSNAPVVICGAGPSLCDQIPMLKDLVTNVMLIAVGHAAPTLVNAGITPHIIVESDCMAFRNWPEEFCADSVLVAGTDVSPSLVTHFERTQWFNGSSHPFNIALSKWNIPVMTLHLGRTVTISAIDLALRLGAKHVVLIGQDLSVSASGISHVDGEKTPPGDATTAIAANDGGTVLATGNLLGLKQDMEDFIRNVTANRREIQIMNCTRGGAVIDGTIRGNFEQFCSETISNRTKPDPCTDVPAGSPCCSDMLQQLCSRMGKYSQLAGRLVQVCANLDGALTESTFDFEKVRGYQSRLKDLMADEQEARTGEVAAEWLNLILHNVDELMLQIPGIIADHAEPMAQVRFLEERFRFAGDLCADITSDLRAVSSQLCQLEDTTMAPNPAQHTIKEAPYVFGGFRRYAIRFIHHANRRLASYLEAHKPVVQTGRFRLTWMNQIVPYVAIRQNNGTWRPLSSFLSMYDDATRDVRQLPKEHGFNISTHGFVLICPGSWVHAFVFGKMFPSANVIIVDPWLDLFSQIIERGCFLHTLSSGALIVAADERCGDWKSLCSTRLQEWKRQGLAPLFFVPPGCRDVPGIPELEMNIRSMA